MGDRADAPAETEQGPDANEPKSRIRSMFGWLLGTASRPDARPDSHPQEAETTQEARTMLHNVRNMAEVRIRDICVPRADIASVPIDAPLAEVVAHFRVSSYSRLPVYDDTLDNPLGLVHLKDLSLSCGFGAEEAAYDLRNLMRPLLYAPPSMPMGVLLQKMQTDRIHMALVIDEYGGVDSLLTSEDLVEQIVGEIADEHDDEAAELWAEEAPGVYLTSARLALADFEAISGLGLLADDMDEDIDTLGGLVFMLAGRVPVRGEIVCHPGGHEFEVVEADPRSLKRLRVRLQSAALLDRAAE